MHLGLGPRQPTFGGKMPKPTNDELDRRRAQLRTTLIKKCAKAAAEKIVQSFPKNIARELNLEVTAAIIEAEFQKEKF